MLPLNEPSMPWTHGARCLHVDFGVGLAAGDESSPESLVDPPRSRLSPEFKRRAVACERHVPVIGRRRPRGRRAAPSDATLLRQTCSDRSWMTAPCECGSPPPVTNRLPPFSDGPKGRADRAEHRPSLFTGRAGGGPADAAVSRHICSVRSTGCEIGGHPAAPGQRQCPPRRPSLPAASSLSRSA